MAMVYLGKAGEDIKAGCDVMGVDGVIIGVKPQPKTYTFTEAYVMMKAGKWMRPLEFSPHNHGAICREHGVIVWRYDSGYTRVEEEISLSLLDSQWEEVLP